MQNKLEYMLEKENSKLLQTQDLQGAQNVIKACWPTFNVLSGHTKVGVILIFRFVFYFSF